jgi:hypothetical protein
MNYIVQPTVPPDPAVVTIASGDTSLLPTEPGVYWLVALDEGLLRNGEHRARPIGRVKQPDPYGILYIGMAESSLQHRAGVELMQQFAVLNANSTWEDLDRTGRTLFFDYYHTDGLAAVYPSSTLAVVYEVTKNPQEAKRLEQAPAVQLLPLVRRAAAVQSEARDRHL